MKRNTSIEDTIELYNENIHGTTVAFNIKNVFSQDTAIYLDKYNICVRAGNHCAKILKGEVGVTNTIRMSLYFYNTKEEIDYVIDLLKDKERILKEMI